VPLSSRYFQDPIQAAKLVKNEATRLPEAYQQGLAIVKALAEQDKTNSGNSG
jgi:hypothetical protein